MMVTPDYVLDYEEDYPGNKCGIQADAPAEVKKKFEIWFNKNFTFNGEGKEEPWYTWDAKVIEKKERSQRPEFRNK